MKLIKFRIRNYKCIKDSGYCYVEPKITILAGKNEAGKTTILEALQDFNIGRYIRKESIPLENEKLKPQIEITFALEEKDLEKIEKRFKIKIPRNRQNNIEVKITKKYPQVYTIDNLESIIELIFPQREDIKKRIKTLVQSIKYQLKNFPFDEENYLKNRYYTPDPEELFRSLHFERYANVIDTDKKINELKEHILAYNKIKKFETDFNDFFKTILPNFILFKSFDDILPDEISIEDVQKNEIVSDLATISDLNLSKIQSDAGKRKEHEKEVNLKFSKEYEQFWTQDHSRLYFWWESDKIYFRIEENGKFYPLRIRSKGRQWHLAFYIRVTARSREEKDNIILIDEPGLFLHAKAQKDILKKLEECSKKKQVIYTTHSPYLIPSNALHRVRLVIKDEKEGTKIEKITAKADKETLTPILTAIGEDLSVGIRVDKKNSVIVEGYSDYLWLQAFKKLLNIKEELNIIPSVGASTAVYIGCILLGWGIDPIFLLDNDKEGQRIKEKLTKELFFDEKRIILTPKDGPIEKLFSQEDYQKYIEKKKPGQSKVLLAKLFHQKVEEGKITPSDLNEETKENFRKLFEKLRNAVDT